MAKIRYELIKNNDSYDTSNKVIDNIITVNNMDKGSVKTLYLIMKPQERGFGGAGVARAAQSGYALS